MPKPKMLIISTDADLSLPLFYAKESAELIVSRHILFDIPAAEMEQLMRTDFQYLYFRDPFNVTKYPSQAIRTKAAKLLARYESAYKVDGLAKFADLLFEDKWRQYRLFSKFMPPTRILGSKRPPAAGEFIKKRLSARSKGVIFDLSDYPNGAKPRDYIVQRQLKIDEEYRVYMVADKVVKPLAIKSSKKPGQKVRLVGLKNRIPQPIIEICQEVHAKTKFDLCGLDIARSGGRYYLLEVNRSCQFKKYHRLSGQNLAVLLSAHLLNLH